MCAPILPADGNRESGFSLLETVISFAIVSLILSGVFGAGIMSLRASDLAAKRTEALMEARSLIDRLGTEIPLVAGTYDGTSERGFSYRLVIDPMVGRESSHLAAFAILAEMRARPADSVSLVSLKTLRVVGAVK